MLLFDHTILHGKILSSVDLVASPDLVPSRGVDMITTWFITLVMICLSFSV